MLLNRSGGEIGCKKAERFADKVSNPGNPVLNKDKEDDKELDVSLPGVCEHSGNGTGAGWMF